MREVIGFNEACKIGSIVHVDLLGKYLTRFDEVDVPMLILREVTSEEWVAYQMERTSEELARKRLKLRLSQFPNAKFYEVSMD